MPVVPVRKILAIPVVLLVSGCASGSDERAAAPAATPTPAAQSTACPSLTQFSKATFLAADRNGDGVIDEGEFAADAAAAFSGEDQNRDYRLARSELPEAPSGSFERLDANGDGVLSFSELRQAKLSEFQRADTNGDGVLSIGEVTRFNATQTGGC